MIRAPLLSLTVLILLRSESRSHASVTVSWSIVDTPGLPGFKTATLFATGTHAPALFDFAGDGSNDAATGKGFFGPLYQQFSDEIPSIFDTSRSLLPPNDPRHDSHFLTGGVGIAVNSELYEEGPGHLQAWYISGNRRNLTMPFAQLVIPNGDAVTYRGTIGILSSTVGYPPFDVSGVIVAVPEPATFGLASVCVALLPLRRRRI
jgi:hypothetical protein